MYQIRFFERDQIRFLKDQIRFFEGKIRFFKMDKTRFFSKWKDQKENSGARYINDVIVFREPISAEVKR